MKSSILKAAAILAVSATGYAANAADSYLYWMLDSSITDYSNNTVTYDYAKVSLDGNYLSLYDGGMALGTEISSGMAGSPAYWGVIDSAGSYNSFVFELYSDSGSTPLHTAQLSFEAARSFIGTSMTAPKQAMYTLSKVPEPTGGLLMLIGMAGLALRRRKVA